MVTVQFSYGSSRARKARFGRRIGDKVVTGLWVLSGLLAALGVGLIVVHLAAGLSLVGLSLLGLMIAIWLRFDIQSLQPVIGALNTDTVQLQNGLEAKLLGGLGSEQTATTLWQAALQQWEGIFMVRRLGVPHDVVADVLGRSELDGSIVWGSAIELARQQELGSLDSGLLVAAILLKIPALRPLTTELRLTQEDIISVLGWQQRTAAAIRAFKHPVYTGGIGRDWAKGYTPLLSQVASNLSIESQEGTPTGADSVHDELASQVIQLLAQNKPVALIGPIGSGKSALVRYVARRLIQADRSSGLNYYQIMALDASAVISSGVGIEELMLHLLGEAVQAKNTILYLDEAQLFFKDGPGTVNITQILLPILQRNSIKLVLSCTEHDWQDIVSGQPAFAGALQRLAVPEAAAAATTVVLQDAALGLEHQFGVTVLQTAITETVRLAARYLPEVAFPGKAITVLESAMHYPQDQLVGAAAVQRAIEATTGAKVTAASQPERAQLLNLEEQIHGRMINQSRAVSVVADALRRSRAGVGNAKRPVGSFLFLGPTGVGKTELAKSLAAIYYGGEAAMVRLDMSEYQQASDVSRLLAPASSKQTGVTLVSGVRQRPSSVVLLDEIEKAHPEVLNLLLQLLDEGRLTDSDGRVVSFRDAIVICTSNAAADEIRKRIAAGDSLESFEGQITDQLIDSHAFKPELLNRFDEIVLFRPLTPPELQQVVGLMIAEVNATLKQQGITVALTDTAAAWLATTGYDPRLGARPLRRLVQHVVENQVAERILAGTISAGQTLTLDAPDLQARQTAKA
jgi:ATP-dependent Clp protease ATP-binding subunit ClpC